MSSGLRWISYSPSDLTTSLDDASLVYQSAFNFFNSNPTPLNRSIINSLQLTSTIDFGSITNIAI